MAFYLGRGVAFWRPSSEGVKALKHPPDPLAYFPSEPMSSSPAGDADRPGGVSAAGAELADWNEINGLAVHLTQTCERIEELAERTEGMLRRVEELAASTTSQLEHTGLIPTPLEIARVREQLAESMPPRHRHHSRRWHGWLRSTGDRLRVGLRTQWLVARVRVGRHLSVPARHAKAMLRKRLVLARVAAAARAEQMVDHVTTALTPPVPPTGVTLLIQSPKAPRLQWASLVSMSGAVAFCAAVGLLLVAISATTPALGLPSALRPALAMTPGPLLLDALLSAPGLNLTGTPTAAPVAPRPQLVTKLAQRPAGFVGALLVESEPAGATVFVNRERVGETPLRLPELRAGSRVIWVESEGYQRWSAGVLVPADKLTKINVKLQRDQR